jgi:hypothetical protein
MSSNEKKVPGRKGRSTPSIDKCKNLYRASRNYFQYDLELRIRGKVYENDGITIKTYKACLDDSDGEEVMSFSPSGFCDWCQGNLVLGKFQRALHPLAQAAIKRELGDDSHNYSDNSEESDLDDDSIEDMIDSSEDMPSSKVA